MTSQTATRTWASNATGLAGPCFGPGEIAALVPRVRDPVHILWDPQAGQVGAATGSAPTTEWSEYGLMQMGTLPPIYPEWLGDPAFLAAHGLRFP